MNALPPRLRPPIIFVLVALVPLLTGGAAYGWASTVFVVPIVVAAAVVIYLAAGRDDDVGAVVRHQADERQADRRLRVQALVGRVMALAVAVAYSIAVATRSTLWPYGVLLGVLVAALLVGWLRYGDRGLSADS